MTTEKIKQKYEVLLQSILKGEQSEHKVMELYAIQFKGLTSYLYIKNDVIPLFSALLIFDSTEDTCIVGNLSNWCKVSNKDTNVTIIVDNRKEGNPKVYINNNENYSLISHKSKFSPTDKLHLYFQAGIDNGIVVAGFDEIEESTSVYGMHSHSNKIFSDFYLISKNLLMSLNGQSEVK